ncbi:MAG: ribosomal L7Ae/L30e/S12e/Gadd45 family protein [Candidatus Aenigmarchaeota archaeon]|nr:ribosomal L7Ae/L30e/S12e/Gadd45 family protein [Candidatus Aenigmarchaeota archaeon]
METITKLPEKKGLIGAREIAAAIKTGKIKRVVIANNCPDFLVQRLEKVKVEKFEGSQRELGTKLGKPFAVAMVGYES